MRHGVVFNLEYQINKCRSSRKMLKMMPQGLHKMHHVRQEPDYNTDGSVSSSGSQEGREDISRCAECGTRSAKLAPRLETRYPLKKTTLVDVYCLGVGFLFLVRVEKKKRIVHLWSGCTGPQAGGLILTPPVTRNS